MASDAEAEVGVEKESLGMAHDGLTTQFEDVDDGRKHGETVDEPGAQPKSKRPKKAVAQIPTDQLGKSITDMVVERAALKKEQDDIKRNLKALRARKSRMMRRAKNLTSTDLMELARLKAHNEAATAAAAKAKAGAQKGDGPSSEGAARASS